MDTGSDFIRPEFLNILFFQQKNLVVFPYVDKKHLHTLEIFTIGHNVVDLESTALHNLKEIIEFESNNTYSQNPTLFFIENTGKEQLRQVMALEGIRCIINSSENISDLANGSRFVFFNKKHGQFVNFQLNDEELAFENHLISSSDNEDILQEQIQKIKIVASRVFRELNSTRDMNEISQILTSYDKNREHWTSILTFTSNYYDIVVPDINDLKGGIKKRPDKNLKDFSDEYEILISTNKAIGKEFVQLLHEYRSKKVNPEHLELEELYNPLKLYNYLRNHHWKEGIPDDFIQDWVQMKISGYTLSESDQEDFHSILKKLKIPTFSLASTPPQQELISEESPQISETQINNGITSSIQPKRGKYSELLFQIDDIDYQISNFLNRHPDKVNNPKLSALTSFIFEEITYLNHILEPVRKNVPEKINTQENIQKSEQNKKILVVDITNILNLDQDRKGKIKVSNIAKVHDAVLKLGYIPKMWADASMRHHVDNKIQYEDILNKKIVKQTPAGTKADIWVLKIAKQRNYKFLANDLYREYRVKFGKEWISKNRLTCVYDDGEFIILE